MSTAHKRKPVDFLKLILGRPVTIKLYSGVVFEGVLACIDGTLKS